MYFFHEVHLFHVSMSRSIFQDETVIKIEHYEIIKLKRIKKTKPCKNR